MWYNIIDSGEYEVKVFNQGKVKCWGVWKRELDFWKFMRFTILFGGD